MLEAPDDDHSHLDAKPLCAGSNLVLLIDTHDVRSKTLGDFLMQRKSQICVLYAL